MLIGHSARLTRLSESGKLPGVDAGSHLGPGKYSVDNGSIAARKKRAGYAGFGSSNPRNLVPVREGPGPGKFQRNQFDFKKKKQKPSSVFKTKQPRFPDQKKGSDLGPGHYKPMTSAFDKTLTKSHSADKKSGSPVRIKREPSAPSVPRSSQSYGYDEDQDGHLKLHKPPKTMYGGAKLGNHHDVNDRTNWISQQLKDTVGPAYYDRPDSSSFADAMSKRSKPGKSAKHVPFAKSKDQRRLFEASHERDRNSAAPSDPSTPGPGHYNHHVRRSRTTKQRSAAFASEVPQLYDAHQIYRASLPGPSNYHPVDETYRNKVVHTGVAAFGSHSARNPMLGPKPDQVANPGPGAYGADTSSFGKTSTSQQLAEFETAFGSTAERPCLAPTKAPTNVGPGAYGDSRTFSALTQKINNMASVGTRGVFSTTAARFLPGVNIDGSKQSEGPGVGRYKIRQPRFQRDRESSSFQSTSTRRAKPTVGRPDFVMLGKDSTPAPGAYNVDVLSIGGTTKPRMVKGKAAKSKAFSSAAPRLIHNQMFGQSIPQGPAPGDYTNANGTIAQKLMVNKRRAATANGGKLGGSTARFQSNGPAVDSYGSGYDANSMLKRSFNRKAGYRPTKHLNRRVVRSHPEHALRGKRIASPKPSEK